MENGKWLKLDGSDLVESESYFWVFGEVEANNKWVCWFVGLGKCLVVGGVRYDREWRI